MKYTEKLVAFMEGKKAEIIKVFGSVYGELYFTKEDKQELLDLSEDSATSIYSIIRFYIATGNLNLSSALCPFCHIVKDMCKDCRYAERHIGCRNTNSDYGRLLVRFNAIHYEPSKVFSNAFYKDLIEIIEKAEI